MADEVTTSVPATSPSPSPMEEMAAMMKALIAPLQSQLKEVLDENTRLREELKDSTNHNFAAGVPGHLRSDDRAVDPGRLSAARSVTIRTRPVEDDPNSFSHIVNPAGLVQNSRSNPLPSEEE